MEKPVLNPHDRLFRFAFADLQVAKDFVAHYLPAEISRELDVETLAPVEGSFIDEALDRHLSDALYRVKLRHHAGDQNNEALIYVLVEHKSYPDRMTARQVLRYIERIWTQEERNHPGRTGLIPILPVVFYHGASTWHVALDLAELIDAPLSFAPFMPKLRFLLWDLNRVDTEQLVGSVQLRLAIRLMTLFQADDLMARLPELADLLREITEPKTVLEWVKVGLYYLSANTGIGKEEVVEMARQMLPAEDAEGEQIMSAIAEVWFRDGLEKGREEGLLRAIDQVALRRFGGLPDSARVLMATFDFDHLNDVLTSALEAPDLDEFLAQLNESTS